MSEQEATATPKTPTHLWVVGILGTLWNAVGAWDYFATNTENEAYMSAFTPEQLEFFYGLPTWVVAFWAVAVWGGVLGTILLLLKRKLAAPVLLASFAGMAITAIHNFGLANGLEIMGTGGALFSLAIFAVSLGLVLYSRAMSQRGVLA